MRYLSRLCALLLVWSWLFGSAAAQPTADSLRHLLAAPCHFLDSARLLNQLSLVFMRVSPDSMRMFGQKAAATAAKHSQPEEQARAYLHLGYSDFVQSRLSGAQQFYLKALPLLTQSGDSVGLSEYFLGIGNLAFQQQNWEEAGEYYRKALKTAETAKSQPQINRCNNNIAMIYLKTGYYEAAEAMFQSLLKAYETADDRQGMAIVYNNLGDARSLMNRDVGEVVGLYLKSVQIQRSISDKVGLANSYMTISKVYDTKAQPDKAIEYARLAFAMYDTLSMEERLIETGLSLAAYLEKHNLPAESLQYAEHARMHATTANLYPQLLQCDLLLARFYLSRKDYLKAEECINEAGPLAATSRDPEAQRQLLQIEKDFAKHK